MIYIFQEEVMVSCDQLRCPFTRYIRLAREQYYKRLAITLQSLRIFRELHLSTGYIR